MPQQVYLDENGEPISSTVGSPVYLDENGEPISGNGIIGAVGKSFTPRVNVMPDEQWKSLSGGEKIRNVVKAFGNVIGTPFFGASETQRMVDNPKTSVAGIAVPVAAKKAVSLIPSASRAGANFNAVAEKANNLPVNVEKAGQSALRLSELSERGGSMPKVARDFLKRTTDPSKGDVPYREARDFYSNLSRISSREQQRLTPVVRRELNTMRFALNDSIGQTAETVGMRKTYESAMKEYARAATLEMLRQEAIKKAVPAALGTGGAYAGYQLLSKAQGK